VQTLSTLRKNLSWWPISVGFGLLLIWVAALAGLLQKYFNGEEFFVYHYANNFPAVEAWQRFLSENGRLIEGIYWTYQYKLFGFNPVILHALSFMVLLIAAVAAAACFLNAWPKERRSKALPYLLVFSFFLNWVSASSVLRLSYDNGRLSLMFFFLSGLALQRWASAQRARWLAASFALFLLSVLTYENTAFLFPALLLLAWPLLPAPKQSSVRGRLLLFGGLAAASALVLLIPYGLYRNIGANEGQTIEHPAMTANLGDLPANVLGAAPEIYLGFGQFDIFRAAPLNLLMAAGMLLILGLFAVAIVGLLRPGKPKPAIEPGSRWVAISLACFWLLLLGPLPYVVLDYPPSGRVYSSAVFGLFPLLFIAYETAKERLVRIAAIAVTLLFAVFCALELQAQSIRFSLETEATLNAFYRGMKAAVPQVEPGTMFIIINGPLENSGCAPSLEMLYNQHDLDCVLLSSTLEKYHAIRRRSQIEANSGTDWEQQLLAEKWILIDASDNVPIVLAELRPGDLDLLVMWVSEEPIHTDYGQIVAEDLSEPSPFYLHLLEREKVLFPQP
jgi:hypothetical protein